MTIQPSNPRVVLCGVGRCGSSMMMRVLQAGGLAVDTSNNNFIDEASKKLLREPYGVFENRAGIVAGNFVNSFKLLDPTKFSEVPSDYKPIFINRTLGEITSSWNEVGARYAGEYGGVWSADTVNRANINFEAWQTILAANPNILQLEYNAVIANPAAMAQTVANYLDSDTFIFNQISAASAVDVSLYIDRRING